MFITFIVKLISKRKTSNNNNNSTTKTKRNKNCIYIFTILLSSYCNTDIAKAKEDLILRNYPNILECSFFVFVVLPTRHVLSTIILSQIHLLDHLIVSEQTEIYPDYCYLILLSIEVNLVYLAVN